MPPLGLRAFSRTMSRSQNNVRTLGTRDSGNVLRAPRRAAPAPRARRCPRVHGDQADSCRDDSGTMTSVPFRRSQVRSATTGRQRLWTPRSSPAAQDFMRRTTIRRWSDGCCSVRISSPTSASVPVSCPGPATISDVVTSLLVFQLVRSPTLRGDGGGTDGREQPGACHPRAIRQHRPDFHHARIYRPACS